MKTEDEALAKFVEAADTLINLLTTELPERRPAWRRMHQARIDDAMNAYDRARIELVGDPADEDD